VSQPNEVLALGRVKTLDRDDDALPGPEPLRDRQVEQLPRPRLDLVRSYPLSKQGADGRKREHGATFLDHAFGKAVRL
jgi:hypothetical protein